MIWGGVISAVADIAGGYLKGKARESSCKAETRSREDRGTDAEGVSGR